MRKKVLSVALLLCTSLVGYAQTEIAKDSVESKHKVFISRIKSNLTTSTKKKTVDFGKADGETGKQFLLDSTKVKPFVDLDTKKQTLKKVYSNVLNTKYYVTVDEFSYSPNTVTFFGKGDKKDKKGNWKNEDIYQRYQTISEVKVKASKADKNKAVVDKSEARYIVTAEWRVKTDKKDGSIKDIKLTAVNASAIDFTNSEKTQMQQTAKELIEKYYANLSAKSQGLEKYADKALRVISDKNVTVVTPNSKTFTVNAGVSSIKVYVAPSIKPEDAHFYTNPTAYYTLAPTFSIKINDDLKTGEITKVDYEETGFQKPETDAEKVAKWESQKKEADRVAKEFTEKLIAHTSADTKDKKTKAADLTNIFENQKDKVEISNVSKAGKEKIYVRTVSQYLSRLKGTGMKINLEQPAFEDGLNIVTYPFNQTFESKDYCDHTVKTIHMKYVNSTYIITKITVEQGSTTPCK